MLPIDLNALLDMGRAGFWVYVNDRPCTFAQLHVNSEDGVAARFRRVVLGDRMFLLGLSAGKILAAGVEVRPVRGETYFANLYAIDQFRLIQLLHATFQSRVRAPMSS